MACGFFQMVQLKMNNTECDYIFGDHKVTKRIREKNWERKDAMKLLRILRDIKHTNATKKWAKFI
jgi:hypothetical protein